MRVPDLAQSLVEAVVGATSLPVTVKMRLGWDDDSLNAPDIARRAVECRGADDHRARPHAAAVLQGRGPLGAGPRGGRGGAMCRWSSMATSSTSRRRREALAQSGAAAVMIGRGAQGQPWVVGQIAAGLAGRGRRRRADGRRARRRSSSSTTRACSSEYGVARRRPRRAQASRLVPRGGRASPVAKDMRRRAASNRTIRPRSSALIETIFAGELREAA